ncbi:hypothetical protein PTT03_10675 [Serratia ureilytica]
MTRTEYVAQMNTVFEEWAKDEAAAITPDGYRVYINTVDKTDLAGI